MYEYTLIFCGTKAHVNADALSRLPLPVELATIETLPELVLLTEHLNDSPVTAKDVRSLTRKDPKFARVQQFLMHGWPSHCDSELDPFTSKRLELSFMMDVFYGESELSFPGVEEMLCCKNCMTDIQECPR